MKRTLITIAIALASFAAHADFAADAYGYQHGDSAQRAALSHNNASMAADLDGGTHSAAIHETASSHPDTRNAAAQAQEAAVHAARYGDMSPKAPAVQQAPATTVQKSEPVGQPTMIDHVPASVTNISGPVVNTPTNMTQGHDGGNRHDAAAVASAHAQAITMARPTPQVTQAWAALTPVA